MNALLYGFVLLSFIHTSGQTTIIPATTSSMTSSCAKGQVCVPAADQTGYMCCEYKNGGWFSANGQSCFPCSTNPCGEDGTCTPDVTDSQGYICHCKDGSTGHTCDGCGDDQMLCKMTRKCIPKSYRCDDYLDCGEDDVTDELNCGEAGCTSDQFQCKENLRCIPKKWECNGVLDCGGLDFSDESKCREESKCPSDFICDSGKCISYLSRCDGKDDCKDMSDEKDADCVARACKYSNFGCGHGHCIRAKSVCDGVDDCGNGKDEDPLMCGIIRCPRENKFRCKNGGCIRVDDVCDFYTNCFDSTDELREFCDAWRGTFGNVPRWLAKTSNRTNLR